MMELGCTGMGVTVTDFVCAIPVKQEFTACTEIVPLAALGVTVIDVVVEVPFHPAGSVHKYEVAPLTGIAEYV
jgi:hypothetical protein